MLLIAQPKSASTSLLYSLAQIMKVSPKNGQNKKAGEEKSLGFDELQKYHGTTVKRTKAFILSYANNKDVLYKEHILPTKEHLDYMKNTKNIVVLLREPSETIESYKRVFSVLPNVKVNYDKLLDEVTTFYNIYNFNDHFLKIYYDEVVNDFHETVKKVLNHYGFEIPKDLNKYELAKKNYNRWGR